MLGSLYGVENWAMVYPMIHSERLRKYPKAFSFEFFLSNFEIEFGWRQYMEKWFGK